MRKETVIAVVLGTVMFVGLLGLGIVMWKATNTEPKMTKSVKNTTLSNNDETSLSVSQNSGLGGGLVAEGSNIGQVDGQQSESKKEDFSEYDKYKDAKSALFGEISQGTGAEVKNGSTVQIYYIGRLTDGTIFDNQWPAKPGDKPKPFEFQIGTDKIIAGLQQGMVGMKVGGKRRIIIPPAVGYGDKGQGSIPPSSVLVFDVELLSAK